MSGLASTADLLAGRPIYRKNGGSDCFIYRTSKNGKKYVKPEDCKVIFERLVPNKAWHPKYAKMLLSDGGSTLLWFAEWVVGNDKIKRKTQYFAKACRNLPDENGNCWAKTMQIVAKLKRKLQRLAELAKKFVDQPSWWYSWVASKASDYELIEAQRGKNPAALLSFLIAKRLKA